jgi:hypothetical protein
VTTLAGDASVQSLSADDLNQLCVDVAVYAAKHLDAPVTCRVTGTAAAFTTSTRLGATDPDIQRECVLAYAACINDAATAPDAGTGIDHCSFQGSCPLTVDELSACVRDQAAAAVRAYHAFPLCNQVTLAWLESAQQDAGTSEPIPASCSNVLQMCPNVYDGLIMLGLSLPGTFLPPQFSP